MFNSVLSLIVRLVYFVYFVCDNIYLMKIWNILNVKNIKIWRNIVFILRFLSISSHLLSNIVYYLSFKFINKNCYLENNTEYGCINIRHLNLDNESDTSKINSENISCLNSINSNKKEYKYVFNKAYIYQSIGLFFDLIPSIRESVLYNYFKMLDIFPYISDGWVAIGGSVSSILEIYSLYEYLNTDGVGDYIVNNS